MIPFRAGEVRIIEYQTQQHRLFPQIARTYAYFFCGQEVIRMYRKNQEQLSNGNVGLSKFTSSMLVLSL